MNHTLIVIGALLGMFAPPVAEAQVGPSRAYPIAGASKKLPMMLIDQKPRSVVLELDVDAEGRVTATRIVRRSDNGIFDERMRGYWKDTVFMPALDAEGRPVADTLKVTNTFSVEDRGSMTLRNLRSRSEIEGNRPADHSARLERMRCRDLLWELDFMKQRAPKARLQHEELFHVAFAMFLAAGNVNEAARDELIEQWEKLVDRTVDRCRERPDAAFWKDVFMPVFEHARPYQSLPVP